MKLVLDIEVYDKEQEFAQAKYLVHGYDDVYWTDSVNEAVLYIKNDLRRYENKEIP